MIVVVEYEDENGRHSFSKWFASLNVQAALKIRIAIARMENGNFSNVKAVGMGVKEYRLNFAAGYRVYFGKGWRQAGDPLRGWHEETAEP